MFQNILPLITPTHFPVCRYIIPLPSPILEGERIGGQKSQASCLGVAPDSQEGCPGFPHPYLRFSSDLLPLGQSCGSSQGRNPKPLSLGWALLGWALPDTGAMPGGTAHSRMAGKEVQAHVARRGPEEVPQT